MRFGISTHLYHDQKLDRAHLEEIAAHGFSGIELFATRSHFDYRDEPTVLSLAQWLAETGLTLQSVHAPITDRFGTGNHWAPAYSNAASDAARRQAAVQETAAALAIARCIPFAHLVVHLGSPEGRDTPGDNHRGQATRSAEEICRLAEPLNVRVAFEVIPNLLSTPAGLTRLIEQELDAPNAGICLDFGHAFLMGEEVPDAIETVSEHVIATHVHDNHRRSDEHLAPYLGRIDWDAALMSMLKIGYEGTYMMELANTGTPASVLAEARRACERFERAVAD
jgi:sugar phosphate isomerase/epimerase